ICTNEGNGRYATNMPDLHVAVMGMERIVRDLNSAAVILKLLGRFATGQRITQYVGFTHGPAACDGPKEVHLVIVDNGRTPILGSRYQEMLRCIRCGACLNVCPVFRLIGGQAFPGCYSGPMGSVLLPLQKGLKEAGEPARACTLCRMCMEVCPVRIPLTDLLLDLRNDLVAAGRTPVIERVGMYAASWIVQHPVLYRLTQKTIRFGFGPRSFEGWVRQLPSMAGKWTGVKDFPLPAEESFLEQRAREARRKGRGDG
ncbi:MAG: LUD domain-containing protein, partial [Planctomycetota bacterium]